MSLKDHLQYDRKFDWVIGIEEYGDENRTSRLATTAMTIMVQACLYVEEDFIKCLAPTYMGSFELSGRDLRDRCVNRIGNLLVPNDNYCKFEDWLMPLLNEMVEEQKMKGMIWSPHIIQLHGEKINGTSSIYYRAAKHKIPVFCPALTGGILGDMIYFHSFRHPGLVVDILSDLRCLNTMAVKVSKSRMMIIGGGCCCCNGGGIINRWLYHICNAKLMRNGADYSVFISFGIRNNLPQISSIWG
ncbi:PREDICTED: probable deoxyhypusine synthase [Bactrocera latifrons]|uniref:probable deoxyhypusine synthase n=1 Tax=Bactrocera latifrons TaxID=174628 RepID=UPI0008DD01F0|nr:PREDICTED: probable deoxyhypusine synthase [Bactrocera latifrons]